MQRIGKVSLQVALLLILSVSNGVAQTQPVFRAATLKINLTPGSPQYLAGYAARVSEGVLDSIYHKILVMDDGTNRFFLVSSDFGKYDPSLYEEVAKRLKSELNISREQFWWAVTHTHSAPEIGHPGLSETFMPERYKQPIAQDYTRFVVDKLVEGIKSVQQKLVPARLGAGWGHSQANINRRAIDLNGKASLGLNPDGPVDRMIGLLRIEDLQGKPIALIANYPIHGTVLGSENLLISGDVAGVVANYVEEKTGAPMLFLNGAAGDIAPIYSVYPNARAGHLGQFRVLLGDRILAANQAIGHTSAQIRLTTGSMVVETPRKTGLGWPQVLSAYNRTVGQDLNLVLIPVQFLKINEEIAIWSAPLELSCEIGMKIRDRSPFPFTFYYGYTNGNLRYLVTEKSYPEGGYETGASPFTPDAERDLTEAVSGYLQGELRGKR